MRRDTAVISAVAGMVMMAASVATAFSDPIAEPVPRNEPVPYRSITSLEASTIENTTLDAWRHIAQARYELHHGNLAGARQELGTASRLSEAIREHLSTLPAKSLIQIARRHLEYQQPRQVIRDLGPIKAALGRISTYLPTDRAESYLAKARYSLEQNDKSGADRELERADQSLMVLEVERPLLGSQRYLKSAGGYLAMKDRAKADAALNAAEIRMMAIFTVGNSPLAQAKESTWTAFRNHSTSNKSETARSLAQARRSLDEIAAGRGSVLQMESATLSREVHRLEADLARDVKVADSDLRAVWEKTAALAERTSAYLAAGLSEEETTLRGEKNLIEARLHLSYAETYQVTTGEREKAATELDKAISYLNKATKSRIAGPKVRKEIHNVVLKIRGLRATPGTEVGEIRERYDAAKSTLNDLIAEI